MDIYEQATQVAGDSSQGDQGRLPEWKAPDTESKLACYTLGM